MDQSKREIKEQVWNRVMDAVLLGKNALIEDMPKKNRDKIISKSKTRLWEDIEKSAKKLSYLKVLEEKDYFDLVTQCMVGYRDGIILALEKTRKTPVLDITDKLAALKIHAVLKADCLDIADELNCEPEDLTAHVSSLLMPREILDLMIGPKLHDDDFMTKVYGRLPAHGFIFIGANEREFEFHIFKSEDL